MALTPYLSSFGDYVANYIEKQSKAQGDAPSSPSLSFRESEDLSDAVVIWYAD